MKKYGDNKNAVLCCNEKLAELLKEIDIVVKDGYIPLNVLETHGIDREGKDIKTYACMSYRLGSCAGTETETAKTTKPVQSSVNEYDNPVGPEYFEDQFGSASSETTSAKNNSAASASGVVGKCPHCGNDIVSNGKGFYKCKNENCGVMFSKYYDKVVSEQEIRALLAGETVELNGLVYNGKTFHQTVRLAKALNGKWLKLEKVS